VKFYYQPVATISPDEGREQFILRPLIPILIVGRSDGALFTALVDTGADNTILPKTVAEYLNIPLQPCEGPAPVAFGGTQLGMHYGEATFHLRDGGESSHWRCRVLFHEGEDEVAVLGQEGFLEYFTAVFDGEAGTLELRPNASLPAGNVASELEE